jgi:two-component system, chemotaxis family, sensor kinase CheA
VDQSQQRLKELAIQVTDLRRGFAGDALHLARVTNDLGEDVMRVRMLPVSTVFDTFPRMVRDLSRELGKQIEVEIAGGETELDRKVLEQIKDPLVHTLRNAVDHGIEMPDVRVRVGKDPCGTVVMSAYQKGNNIVIQISDDGAGIDVEKVKRSALKNGIISSEEAENMSAYEAMRLIFTSGLSTSAVITDVSGRGVGMDVVRKNVEELHGSVDIESTLGQGTTLTLTLPLTLATTLELLVKVHDQTFGIPISAVERIQRINTDEIRTVEAKEAIIIDNEPVTLVHLAQILELPPRDEEDVRGDHKIPVVILKAGRKRIAFRVDAVVGQQESVVKSLGKQLKRVRNVAGATILGTGRIIMSLNPLDLIKCARLMAGSTVVAHRAAALGATQVRKPRVLVVDDSLTTRNLEKTILETAGYEVEVAINGAEALNILRAEPCDVVVSDVLMPELDGFELTATMRKDPHLSEIPVILVTSLDSRSDRERGIDVGANAYIVKSAFEQDSLLSTIERLA